MGRIPTRDGGLRDKTVVARDNAAPAVFISSPPKTGTNWLVKAIQIGTTCDVVDFNHRFPGPNCRGKVITCYREPEAWLWSFYRHMKDRILGVPDIDYLTVLLNANPEWAAFKAAVPPTYIDALFSLYAKGADAILHLDTVADDLVRALEDWNIPHRPKAIRALPPQYITGVDEPHPFRKATPEDFRKLEWLFNQVSPGE
jgi:hypothetical protein